MIDHLPTLSRTCDLGGDVGISPLPDISVYILIPFLYLFLDETSFLFKHYEEKGLLFMTLLLISDYAGVSLSVPGMHICY